MYVLLFFFFPPLFPLYPPLGLPLITHTDCLHSLSLSLFLSLQRVYVQVFFMMTASLYIHRHSPPAPLHHHHHHHAADNDDERTNEEKVKIEDDDCSLLSSLT